MITRDSYFTVLFEVFTTHILEGNTYFVNHIEQTEHAIVILKRVSTKLSGKVLISELVLLTIPL